MAFVKAHGLTDYVATLDPIELQTLKIHADRNTLSLSDALADLIERGLSLAIMEFTQEEIEARDFHSEDSLTIMLHIRYPREGPLSVFDGTDKGLIACMLINTLELGVQTVRHSHKQMESKNVVERQNEGMGTGVAPIPID